MTQHKREGSHASVLSVAATLRDQRCIFVCGVLQFRLIVRFRRFFTGRKAIMRQSTQQTRVKNCRKNCKLVSSRLYIHIYIRKLVQTLYFGRGKHNKFFLLPSLLREVQGMAVTVNHAGRNRAAAFARFPYIASDQRHPSVRARLSPSLLHFEHDEGAEEHIKSSA